MQLDGHVTLVTGASRGIGRGIATHLADQGAVVIGTATGESGVERIADDLRDRPNPGAGRVLDVRDGQAVRDLVNSIAAEFGAVQILVNNAGISRGGLLRQLSEENWDAVLDTNLKAVWRVAAEAANRMIAASAKLLWKASRPPRRIVELPLFKQRTAQSIVTFGRDS